MISTPTSLQEFLTRIENETSIALDTEADSLHSYYEKICLIQIGFGTENLLVDSLAIPDLSPLFLAIQNKRIILHGADYDIRLISRRYDFQPSNLFDTMIAARLCGFPELGLAALVEKYFGVQLSKSSQKANWAQRPLSERMIEYARNDTRYLHGIAAHLEAELERLDRRSWFDESRDRMITTARDIQPRDEETAWRIRGSHALAPRAQSILRALWQWRDTQAARWDRPAFHVINNEHLIAIARNAAEGKPVSLPPRMTQSRHNGLTLAIAQALDIPASEWPKKIRTTTPRPTAAYTRRIEKLRSIRDKQAATLALDPSIIAPRQALDALATDPDSTALMLWQRELLKIPHPNH